ncbi:hypothetical protein CIPAW_05G018900 [Carya illinoinensis]|uniref:Uncharacterized protein n=1 Tax=Carya illinoinensis TaxID=32201 RepID=A0A8T1QEE3_CARIL|nr:hypothetical protein CIPAW_05G018900 [Carya illinoinensis]
MFGLIQNRWIGGHMGRSPSVQKPISSLGSSNRTGRAESFGKVSMSRINPSVPLVAAVSIMALCAAYLAARWSTTLTRVGSSSVGRVVAVRTTSLVATGSRLTSIGAATISGCECRRSGIRRLKGALEQLKTFGFRD